MIHWAILGAGGIAHRFAASLLHHPDSILCAISCRNAEKAAAFAAQFGVPRRYLSHEALLADPEVDAVYLALPHGLHKEWAVRALQAGKAVLCEKPAALNADEMEQIAAAARGNGRLFMEAMKPRFVPLYARLRELVGQGAIGELTGISASRCSAVDTASLRPGCYLLQPGQGGILLDCGCYCASWLEDWLPARALDEALCGGALPMTVEDRLRDGIDVYVRARMEAGSVQAELECAMDRSKPRVVVLTGTEGRLVVEEMHRPQTAVLYRGGQTPERVESPYVVDDFYGEICHFAQCLQQALPESPVMPLAAFVRIARLMDRIRAEFEM